jgi:hypothetical protein
MAALHPSGKYSQPVAVAALFQVSNFSTKRGFHGQTDAE